MKCPNCGAEKWINTAPIYTCRQCGEKVDILGQRIKKTKSRVAAPIRHDTPTVGDVAPK